MTTKLTIVLLIIGQQYLFSQLKTDTIDYSSINEKNTYKLNKVLSADQQTRVKYTKTGGMSFITDGTTIKNIEHYFTKYKLPISITDTIMAVDFYIAKNTTDLGQLGHQFALTHINKKTNTLLLHKVDYDKYVKLTFKIYKWTKSEIIIKDITPERPNRIYYLTRE